MNLRYIRSVFFFGVEVNNIKSGGCFISLVFRVIVVSKVFLFIDDG